MKIDDILVLNIFVNECFASLLQTDQLITLMKAIWRDKRQNTVIFVKGKRWNLWAGAWQSTYRLKAVCC